MSHGDCRQIAMQVRRGSGRPAG